MPNSPSTAACLLLPLIESASLNGGSLRPRSERAETTMHTDQHGPLLSAHPAGAAGSPAVAGGSANQSEQLEFDFVNLPGYGVLDDANSSAGGNFSCYARRYGYYADIAKQCTLFHLCYPVKEPGVGGEIAYQRFSFACSDQSQFDQQHLLCLEPASVSTACDASEQHFDASNRRLVAALQQSAPGLFSLSEEGAVLNATAAQEQPTAGAEPSVLESAVADEQVAPSAADAGEPFY